MQPNAAPSRRSLVDLPPRGAMSSHKTAGDHEDAMDPSGSGTQRANQRDRT